MLLVQPSACNLSNASLQPQQQGLQPAPVPHNRSAFAAVPNAIDVDPIEYMLDAFDNCISHMLVMPTPMQTFIRICVYRKMVSDFAPQEFGSSTISTLDDRVASCSRCFARLGFAYIPSETI